MKRIFQARALLHRPQHTKLLRKTCGHGVPDAKGPFDATTRTEDLRGLMDSLGIAEAHLAGWSLAGNDITAMACTHPERADSIVYLEGAYDWGSPAVAGAFPRLVGAHGWWMGRSGRCGATETRYF